MRTLRFVVTSFALVTVLTLWFGASATAATGNEPMLTADPSSQEEESANGCWQCTVNSDCDSACGPGAGVCRWSGCTKCLCTM
jgi:hypothetical protein